MADDPKTFDRPPLTITLSTGQKIKMTYGLEMDIRRMLPDPTNAIRLALDDPFTMDYLVRRCLTDKKGMVENSDELIKEIDDDLTVDDTEKMVMWAVEHVLYFFAKRATAMAALGSKFQLGLPVPLINGSTTSPSTTPSAGPSE